MSESEEVSFSIPQNAAIAIQLDERSMWPKGRMEYTVSKRGRGHSYNVICDKHIAEKILADLKSRASSDFGFDQPAAWVTACRQASHKVWFELERCRQNA